MSISLDDRSSLDARALRASPIRAFAKLINDPSIISFAGGVPNPGTFPSAAIARCAHEVLTLSPQIALQYGPTPGLPALREFLASFTTKRGIECTAESVLVTSGSQQALALIAQVLLDPGDVVLVELPTYIGGSASFYARRAELIGVAQDDDGIVPESLRETASRLRADGRTIKLLYTTPNFQNPSGRLMTRARRRAVLEIAREFDFLVLEDDPYGELQYLAGLDTTPIKAEDADERVIYLSSFSKILSPGLRCGWVVGPQRLLRLMELAKESADLCSGMLDQSIIERYCLSGDLPDQIDRVREFYRARRAVMIDALEQELAGHARWTEASGGLFTFVTFNDPIDTQTLLESAVAAGVAYIPGAPFFVDGSGRNTMRLTFAKETDERMRAGVQRLADVLLGRTRS